MEIVKGIIKEILPEGLWIYAPYTNLERACVREYHEVSIGLNDGRKITPKQMRKTYALLNEISDWMGETTENTKTLMKVNFNLQVQEVGKRILSLADCDVTTAREFITLLIEFMIENDVPSSQPLYELNDDIEKYVYACLINKKCCVCGRTAQLHHANRVGMGRDRDDIFQIGMAVMPLCGEHHMECHSMSQNTFNVKYHIVPISLTKEIGKKYSLTNKNLGGRT